MKSTNLKIILLSILTFCTFSLVNIARAALVIIPCADEGGNSGCQESQRAQKLYQERVKALAPYSVVFEEVGVKLTPSTSESQYNSWYERVVVAKASYDRLQEKITSQKIAEEQTQKELAEQAVAEKSRKEKEAENKIKELEKRVFDLENEKNIVKPPVIPTAPKLETSVPKIITPVKSKKNEQVISPKKSEIVSTSTKLQKTKVVFEQSVPTSTIQKDEIKQTSVKEPKWWNFLLNWFTK